MEAGVRVWSQSLWRILARVPMMQILRIWRPRPQGSLWARGDSLVWPGSCSSLRHNYAQGTGRVIKWRRQSVRVNHWWPSAEFLVVFLVCFFFLTWGVFKNVFVSLELGAPCSQYPVPPIKTIIFTQSYSNKPAAFQLFHVTSPTAWPIASHDPLLLRVKQQVRS